MSTPSRLAKRLVLPVLLIAVLVFAVQSVVAAPAADFDTSQAGGAPANGCKTVNFTNTSGDSEDATTTFEDVGWDLDNNGTFDDATGQTTSRVFPAAGTYTVGITATDTDGAGGTVTTSKQVAVTSTAPTATVNAPNNVQAGVAAQYSAAGQDTDGNVVSYAWDFDNDGQFNDGTGATASHTYATAGAQTARVQVTDNCGLTGTGSAPVTVGAAQAPPVPSFTMQVNNADVGTVNPGTAVTFSSTSTDPNNDALTYSWSLDGDNAFDDGTTQTVTKTYPTFPTVKTVRVRLSVSDGVATVQTFQDLVINKSPYGAFTVTPEAPLINEAVTFDAAASFDFENAIQTYEWDFNYGGTPAGFVAGGTGASISHAFTAAGPRPVALRVTDNDGGVTVVARTVTVQVTRPTAALTFTPANPLPGEPVTLTSTSTPSASPGAPSLVATQWDFDYQPTADFTLDGAGGSIVTSFSTPGAHTVAVRVTQTGGGFDTASATIPVNAPPQASFTVSPTKPVEGKEVTFASTSGDPDGPLANQEWDLDGDGTFERSGGVVSTTKLKHGTRTVRLRVTDSKGATATSVVAVKVAAKPLKSPNDINSTVLWSPRSGGIHLVGLLVKVPSDTSVSVTCKGGGCPRGTFRKHSRKKKGARLTFSKLEANLRAGAKISIIFARPGHMTGWDTITIRGRGKDRTDLREGCKIGRAKKQKRCP